MESTGGFVLFIVDLNNGCEGEVNVEFWMIVVGFDGLIIFVNVREKWVIVLGDIYLKVCGINFDKSYLVGEYIINV